MSTISSPGIGSGLDVKSIVSQLIELEKKPLTQLQLKATVAQTKLSVVGQIKSLMSSLDDAVRPLTSASAYQAMSVTSGNEAVSGTALFTAKPATYSVAVNHLARGQTTYGPSLAPASTVGSGTLTLQVGEWDGGVFAPGSAASFDVAVASTDTLSDIASKINDKNGGLTASVVADAGGEKLVIRSVGTGAEQGFRVQVSDDDATPTDNNGLSRLAYDPAAGSFGQTLAQAAQDTEATIDGVTVTSSTNTITSAISGVTLKVNAVTTGAVNVQIKRDTASVQSRLEGFVDAFNNIATMLADATKYDNATGESGPLQGDSTIVTLQSALKRLVGSIGPNANGLQRLSDIGLELGRDGKLAVNSTKLNAALERGEDLQSLMTTDSSTGKGLALQLRAFTAGALGETGRLGQKSKAMESEIARYDKEESRLSERISRTEARLNAQYSRLDGTMANLTALNAYVTQQVTAWNNQKSR